VTPCPYVFDTAPVVAVDEPDVGVVVDDDLLLLPHAASTRTSAHAATSP
jgi:hypothetical protein